jgi:hypothetical protein
MQERGRHYRPDYVSLAADLADWQWIGKSRRLEREGAQATKSWMSDSLC